MNTIEETPFRFEWDRSKAEENAHKHGIEFEVAILIFRGDFVTNMDSRHDYGEERYTSIGSVGEDCLVVVHTCREGRYRIISARRGGRRDRRKLGKDDVGGS